MSEAPPAALRAAGKPLCSTWNITALTRPLGRGGGAHGSRAAEAVFHVEQMLTSINGQNGGIKQFFDKNSCKPFKLCYT